MKRPPTAFALALALSIGLLSACSVPRDETARIITEQPQSSTPPSNSAAPVATVARRVYFVRSNDQKLEALDTEVAVPGEALELLEALRKGPDEQQRRAGYQTKVPDSVRFDDPPPQIVKPPGSEGEIRVFITHYSGAFERRTQQLMYQQIVYTLSESGFPNIVFDVNNKGIIVPLPDEKGPGEAVTRADFSSLNNVVTTTTTTTTTTLPPNTALPATTAPAAPPPTTNPPTTSASATATTAAPG